MCRHQVEQFTVTMRVEEPDGQAMQESASLCANCLKVFNEAVEQACLALREMRELEPVQLTEYREAIG